VSFFTEYSYLGITLDVEKNGRSSNLVRGLGLGNRLLPFGLSPDETTRFSLKIHYFPIRQNAGQLAKMYSPNFVDNMVVAKVYSFRSYGLIEN